MLRVYNTLSRKKEKFEPVEEGKVGIYVCGPTVYNYPHIGHARTYIAFDVMIRYLRYRGYRVKYIVNITNVDDKIIARAKELGRNAIELADFYERAFFEDIAALGIERADAYPRVTDHIPEIIKAVKKLIENGCAYESGGDVYFRVSSAADYGRLSKQNLKEKPEGKSLKKRHPLDFALWKAAKEGEPAWQSPWGTGRPGWHIECSVMSSKYLGERFDIHGGAIDLIFPHHENEIAQAECATGREFVKYWIHTGFLNVEGKKMSKSLGNFITVRDFLKKYGANEFRLLVLSTHYRSQINFSYESLEKGRNALQRLYSTIDSMKTEKEDISVVLRNARKDFEDAMDDDFDTPKALAVMFGLARKLRKANPSEKCCRDAAKLLGEIMQIFGIEKTEMKIQEKTAKKVEALAKKLGISGKDTVTLIDSIIVFRDELRRKKEYRKADMIRKEMGDAGIIIEDGEKTTWRLTPSGL